MSATCQRRLKAGQCTNCAKPDTWRYRCEECRAEHRAKQAERCAKRARDLRRWRAANPSDNADHMRRLRASRVETGLCACCGVAERRPGLQSCQGCADRDSARRRARQEAA